ncbi:MAG: uS17 family ribosomal protein [Candidatus Berkelbacteria bacterium]
MTNKENAGKIISGTVVSMLMNKTIVVDIERSKTHRLYGKSFKVNNKIKARNEIDGIVVGDSVIIAETRPISKSVSFIVVKKGNK